MTLPPPAFAGLQTGNRGMRRGAPVSDRPGAGFAAAGSSLPLPLQGAELSLALSEALFFTGIGWAAVTHAVWLDGVPYGPAKHGRRSSPRRAGNRTDCRVRLTQGVS